MKQISISIPNEVLEKLDKCVKWDFDNRSKFIVSAIVAKINKSYEERILDEIHD